MRHFYEQVRADDTTFYFFMECDICRKRKYGRRLPLLCRSKILLRQIQEGQNSLRSRLYNHYHAAAVQELAIQFNRCELCEKWVCDDCFCNTETNGCCVQCADITQA